MDVKKCSDKIRYFLAKPVEIRINIDKMSLGSTWQIWEYESRQKKGPVNRQVGTIMESREEYSRNVYVLTECDSSTYAK